MRFNMANKTLGLESNLYQYFQQVSVREAEILKELREETKKQPMAIMQIATEQGQFMA